MRRLSTLLCVEREQIAAIGDMPNYVLMFGQSGLSIAMGNASRDVKRTARRVTTSNDEDGFATAMDESDPTCCRRPSRRAERGGS